MYIVPCSLPRERETIEQHGQESTQSPLNELLAWKGTAE